MGSVDLDPSGFSGTLDDISDGSTYKKLLATERTKLTGIDAGAEVNPADLADLDVTAANKLATTIVTAPTTGQHKVETIQRKPDETINFTFNDTPES